LYAQAGDERYSNAGVEHPIDAGSREAQIATYVRLRGRLASAGTHYARSPPSGPRDTHSPDSARPDSVPPNSVRIAVVCSPSAGTGPMTGSCPVA